MPMCSSPSERDAGASGASAANGKIVGRTRIAIERRPPPTDYQLRGLITPPPRHVSSQPSQALRFADQLNRTFDECRRAPPSQLSSRAKHRPFGSQQLVDTY